MNIANTVNSQSKSTYSLLVTSEEKGRAILEIAVFVACILSIVFTISQFAQTPLTTSPLENKSCVACHTTSKSDVRAGS
jgi:hypothetical protein